MLILSLGVFSTKKLQQYELLEPYELKHAYDTAKIKRKNGMVENFLATPDLRQIVRSSMWDDLVSFSDYVYRFFK